MGKRRDLTLGVVIVFAALWALLPHTHIDSWNEFSRLAAVEALVERGTWIIDDTALSQSTGDKVFLNGHFYSDKPPTLTFIASGVYAVLHHGLGLTFDATECDPKAVTCYCFAFQCPRPFDLAYYLITLILVGLPSALMLAFFYRSTELFGLSNIWALLLTGVLGSGTLILPYSLVLNNHVPAAVCLFVGLYALIHARSSSVSARWLALAGSITSLGVSFEFNVAPFLILVFIVAWWHHRRRAWPFIAGAVWPVLLTMALDWWMLGSILPPQLFPGGYNYPGSTLYTTPGGTRGSPDVLMYGFRMLVGDHGVFAFSPVLLWALVALGLAIRQRNHRLWWEAAAVGLASLFVTVYILFFTDNFGGGAFGPRWFITITPLLFLFAAEPMLYSTARRKLIFIVLSAFSVISAWQGASGPWHSTLPLLRLETSAAASVWPQPLSAPELAERSVHPLDVTFEGIRARLRGYSLNADTVRPGDPVTVTLYWQALAPMSGSASLFIHLVNSIDALSAQRDVALGLRDLPTTHWKPGAIYADAHRLDLPETAYAPDTVLVQVGLYRAEGARLAARSAEAPLTDSAVKLALLELVPRPGSVPNPAWLNFGNQLALAGYDLNNRVIRPGETLSVTLYWQSLALMQKDYAVFAHLTDGRGNVVAADDGLPYTQPKRTSRWTLQVMQETRPLKLPADAPTGFYQVTLGVFGDEGRLPIVAPAGHYLGEEWTLVQVRVNSDR